MISLLYHFERSLSLDDEVPRPPTPPPSRRPPKLNTRTDNIACLTTHKDHPEPGKCAQPGGARVWFDARWEEGGDKDCRHRKNLKRTRFVIPNPEDEEGDTSMDATRRTSGPLRSILRNKHAGGMPYQKVAPRHAHAVQKASVKPPCPDNTLAR